MCTEYHSLAVAPTNLAIPEDIMVTTIAESGSCGLKGCVKGSEHEHFMISWHGNGYSESRTWISAEEGSVIDLEDAR